MRCGGSSRPALPPSPSLNPSGRGEGVGVRDSAFCAALMAAMRSHRAIATAWGRSGGGSSGGPSFRFVSAPLRSASLAPSPPPPSLSHLGAPGEAAVPDVAREPGRADVVPLNEAAEPRLVAPVAAADHGVKLWWGTGGLAGRG